jgi:hypothetical protein
MRCLAAPPAAGHNLDFEASRLADLHSEMGLAKQASVGLASVEPELRELLSKWRDVSAVAPSHITPQTKPRPEA